MASKPVPRRLKDGTVKWRMPFRLVPGGPLTSETFDTAEDARAFGALVDRVGGQAAREARNASDVSALDMPTLATWFEQHLTEVDAHAARGTAPEYRRVAARTWMPMLGHLTLDAITRAAVVRWVAAQRTTETARSAAARRAAIAAQRKDPDVVVPAPAHWSPKSIRNAHAILSDALASAVAAGHIPSNVAKGVPMPSDHERDEMVTLTQDEAVRLLGAFDDWWRPLVATLYSTGLRWGEATALQVGDLDLDAPIPVLRVSRAWKKDDTGVYLGSPKTRRALRTVALAPELVPVLAKRCKGRGPDDLVFTSREGARVQAAHFRDRVWLPAVARSGIGKRPRVHDLRHTHASLMIARGMDMLTLQRRLGHESVKTTGDTYGHLRPDVLEASAALAGGTLPQIGR